jgi:hypothetical protein
MAMLPYKTEDVLQKLLEDYPGVLAGEGETSNRRFLLIKRELGVPDQAGASNRWRVDHVFVDDEGTPTFVETKLGANSQIRREIVGQMLEYAANGLSNWGTDQLRHVFEERHGDSPEPLRDLLGENPDPENFWERVRTNLEARKVRLVFVADDVPRELRALIEFLNEQMRTVEVLGLEVKQYGGEGGLRTLVAASVGKTQAAQQAKGEREPSARELQYKGFWADFLPELHKRYPGWSRSQTPTTGSWLELPTGRTGIAYSLNFTTPRRLRAEVYLYDGAQHFPRLLAKKGEIDGVFGAGLSWEELPERRASRIAVYRDSSDVGTEDEWPAYREWLLDMAGRLRDTFQPHIEDL